MIDIKLDLLIGQVVTFLIGMFLLYLIAYKPIKEMFRKRAEKIENDLKSAEQSKVEMEKLKEQFRTELSRIEEKAMKEIKQEVVNLSILVAERVISTTVDPVMQKKLVDEVFSELEKNK